MRLRARLLVTMVALALPIVLGLSWYAFESRREALLESTYEATLQRMERRGREQCEQAPRVFRGRRRGHRERRLRGRWAYDERFVPSDPETRPMDPELRRALEGGEPVAAIWKARPDRARIAMRMPWDGPCAVIVVERPVGPALGIGGFLGPLGWSTLVALLMALVALLALGPMVRRIRRLTASVRAQASGGYEADVEVRGKDEVAELARAFNEASAEIRRRLTELDARDRALTEFLASTTHDVMIPLTVLSGHLSDVGQAVEAGEAPDRDKVKAALEETHYLASLMRNLSAAARLDAGEPMLKRLDVDLREVVERVVIRHRPLARQRRVSLDFAVPEEPVVVNADSTLAEQALSNLVSNAVRYNHEGGHVAVILEASAPQGAAPGFEVRVLDDGPGIPEEELEHVSERRFRGGAARQRRPTGLGLGLHIVRDVAQKHGWELRFESPPEGGLSVRLSGAASA